jgi:hypothetical protein
MARVLFQRARSGFRTVRGEIVRRIQSALRAADSDPRTIDGVYGSDTETALQAYQTRIGLQVTGKVTDETWRRLLGEDPPSLKERCLQLTGDFEGTGFRKVVGNFDGAGITWGIIGFTLRHGELGRILRRVREQHPVLFDQAFTTLADEMVRVLGLPASDQLDWANGISIGSRRYRVAREWEEAFDRLGGFPEVQAIQLEGVDKYWSIALRDAERFDIGTEMGMALCFDVAVQNGGIDHDGEERRIKRWMTENPGASEQQLRLRIADVVAENSVAKYVEDVRSRKRAIASGEGLVHGGRYAIAEWAIGELPR